MDSSALGYIFDFMASFFVVSSLILRPQHHIKMETSTFFNSNPLAYEGQLKTTRDAWIAITQFFLGLVCHLIHFEISVWLGIFFVSVVLLASCLFHIGTSKKITVEVKNEYDHYDTVKEKVEKLK